MPGSADAGARRPSSNARRPCSPTGTCPASGCSIPPRRWRRKAAWARYNSQRFAGGLAERLRERIYDEVVPALAQGIAAARDVEKPGPAELDFARLADLDDTDAAESFFDFRVADVAMGSGHFLIAAIDRIERGMADFLVKRNLPGVRSKLALLRGPPRRRGSI